MGGTHILSKLELYRNNLKYQKDLVVGNAYNYEDQYNYLSTCNDDPWAWHTNCKHYNGEFSTT